MKLFLRYLKSKRLGILFFFFCAALLCVSFFLYRLPALSVIYPIALCLVFGAAALFLGFLRAARRHKRDLRKLSLPPEELPPLSDTSGTLAEADALLLSEKLRGELVGEKEAARRKQSDTVDYYTTWVHQIKTPISAMDLALQAEDTPLARKLKPQLNRTRQYVDMVLAYTRMNASSTDYVFEEVDLDALLRASFKKFSSEFFLRHLSLRYVSKKTPVLTDAKWFSFLFEQLLSNALKYTREGGITVKTDGHTLTLSDTGIGIAPEDLPRIFEPGYTGKNGRIDPAASGLGLPLCRRIADALGIGLSIESTLGAGTLVTLVFPENGKTRE